MGVITVGDIIDPFLLSALATFCLLTVDKNHSVTLNIGYILLASVSIIRILTIAFEYS